MAMPIGIAVDLENLRGNVKAIVALLRSIDDEQSVVALVGAQWAQDLIGDVPGAHAVFRVVSGLAAEAADDEIHGLLARWRGEGRVAVVASGDGGYAESLAAHRAAGVPAVCVATEPPARRLGKAAPVFRIDDRAGFDAAVEEISRVRG